MMIIIIIIIIIIILILKTRTIIIVPGYVSTKEFHIPCLLPATDTKYSVSGTGIMYSAPRYFFRVCVTVAKIFGTAHPYSSL